MAISDKRKESMYNYAKKNLKRIPLDVQKEKYEEIKAAAESAGESVNGYIKKALEIDEEVFQNPPSEDHHVTYRLSIVKK